VPADVAETSPGVVSTDNAVASDSHQCERSTVDGAHLLPRVRAGIAFVDGVQQEQKDRKQTSRAA
jgi:hypothetical protein